METLDLKNLNVQDIDGQVMKNLNGGIIWWPVKAFAGALLVELIVDGWAQCKADFMEGYKQ